MAKNIESIDSKGKGITQRINTLSSSKLDEIDDFLNDLDPEVFTNDVLSYAGLFADMDSSFIESLTTKLHENRLNESPEFLRFETCLKRHGYTFLLSEGSK